MATVSDDALKNALEQRRKHIETNLECVLAPAWSISDSDRTFVLSDRPVNVGFCSNLTMKACRKLLEEDLGLPEKSLAGRKEFIQRYVDKVIPGHRQHVVWSVS